MKFFAIFALLIASISNLSGSDAFVVDQLNNAIEELKQSIRERGLDPFHIKRESAYYALPVPVIFNAGGFCEEVLFTGLSDIVINDMDFDIFTFRLSFDLEIPQLHGSVGLAVGEAVVFDNKLFGEGSGSLDVYNARVKGVAVVGIGVTVDFYIHTLEIDSSIRAIESNLLLNIQGIDLSNYLNEFLGGVVPRTLEAFKPEMDELISIVAKDYINDNILS